MYEVEMKFPVTDVAAFEARLGHLGATIAAPQAEVDTYFSHPARDFRQTDEALRIRRKGESNFLTYKGPKIDQTTKTRREIELPLPPGQKTPEAWTKLLFALGFAVVGQVRKSRRRAQIAWHDHRVEGTLDEVEGLGPFVELELVVEEQKVGDARAAITLLAETLGLVESERRSYLELLIEHGRRGEHSTGQ